MQHTSSAALLQEKAIQNFKDAVVNAYPDVQVD